MNQVLGLFNYWIVIFLMMTGFYIVIARTNLIQKVIGLNIFQISVFLLYITMGKVTGGTAPILQEHDSHHPPVIVAPAAVAAEHHADVTRENLAPFSPLLPGEEGLAVRESEEERTPATHENSDPEHGAQQSKVVYSHPLPSVLMLTAIVVGVATTAVALALIIRIGEAYGTIEEDEILQLDRETT